MIIFDDFMTSIVCTFFVHIACHWEELYACILHVYNGSRFSTLPDHVLELFESVCHNSKAPNRGIGIAIVTYHMII